MDLKRMVEERRIKRNAKLRKMYKTARELGFSASESMLLQHRSINTMKDISNRMECLRPAGWKQNAHKLKGVK